jgi:transcriptional regulator with XRE-family HTH domain
MAKIFREHHSRAKQNNEELRPENAVIGARIRMQRDRLGITQQELGGKLGVTLQQVHKYEKGISRVSSSRLNQIARALRTKAAYFLGEHDLDRAAPDVLTTIANTPGALEVVKVYAAMSPAARNAFLKFLRLVITSADHS